MDTKTFEIRDKATFIPMLAVKLRPSCEQDRFLLARAGFGTKEDAQAEYVLLCQIYGGGGECTTDPYDWHNRRTYTTAHDFIITHWDELSSGAVIDVECILNETTEPKRSEAETSWPI